MQMIPMFSNEQVTKSRIIHTPSIFARKNLLYLQEVGNLVANNKHIYKKSNLKSYLFLIVTKGSGTIKCEDETYNIRQGECAFIDCRKKYSHFSSDDLWSVEWHHFYGENMDEVYKKYIQRGGQIVFSTSQNREYCTIVRNVFRLVNSNSYIKDVEINGYLTDLITHLMKETVRDILFSHEKTLKNEISNIKGFLDENYSKKINLDDLSNKFYINKNYLNRIFKEKFGITITHYVSQVRITKSKELLRFTDKTIENIAIECGFDGANYYCRVFKKIEGITPREYRKNWQ